MGFLAIFKRRKFENFEDEEEIEEKKEAEATPDVSISGQHDIKICKPKTLQQAFSAIDCMTLGRTVLLNLECIEPDVYQRVIDFMSGAAYALNFSINKVANDTYVIALKDVDVSGEAFETSEEDEEYFTI